MDFKEKAVKAFEDTKDAVDERRHEAAAQAEHAKRDVAGEEMTPGENVASIANEAKNKVQSEIDRTKRNLRDGE